MRDQHDDKKRALVMGKFKFLYQDETEDLEAGDKFQLAIVQNKLLGPVKYSDKDGKDPDVLHIYGKERQVGEGFSNPDIKIPGVLDLFTVVWSNPFGDLYIDQDIKLFEFEDIQKYSGYNDGPKSKEFCRFYTSSSSKELDGFDSSIFWSAGLLCKYFRTCGVEKWDMEMRELVEHYRNWKAWTHEVHNLPNNPAKRFSDNPYSGPASTSTSYSRDRRSSGNNNTTSECTPAPKKPPPPPHYNPSIAPPTLTAPPAGQTVLVPIPGPDGSMVQVQLSTLPTLPTIPTHPTPPLPGVSSLSTPSRYKYINPHMVPTMSTINTSHPPPGYTAHSVDTSHCSTWTNQVDDFLSRPKSRTSSGDGGRTASRSCSPITSRLKAPPTLTKSEGPKKVKVGGKRKVTLVQTTEQSKKSRDGVEDNSPIKVRKIDRSKILARMKAREEQEEAIRNAEKAKFTPKASILPPSPAGKAEVNELDISPEYKVYKGVIMDWKGKFGFINCQEINGKIFVHSKDFLEGREFAELGVEASFQVLHQDSSVVGAKAVNVKISKPQ